MLRARSGLSRFVCVGYMYGLGILGHGRDELMIVWQ